VLFHIINISSILKTVKPCDLANRIAEKVLLGHHELILFNLHKTRNVQQDEELFSQARLICELINKTGCPVLSWSKKHELMPFKNILQHVDPSSTLFKGYERIMPLLKTFNSCVHLLMINNPAEGEIDKINKEILCESRAFFVKYNIKTKVRTIEHRNELETILAYGSVIEADLIGNKMDLFEPSNTDISESKWLNILYRSDVAVYNYSR
jgi:hypothetical protein